MTAFRYLKDPDEGLNIVKFFLKKYWRYTPQYALTLALLLVTPTWGSGPSWFSRMNPMYKNCRDHWWYNILYINNFMDSSEVCLDHTWVFAVYAQLHVLSVFILIPLKMRPRIGLLVNFLLAVVSLASVALTNVYYDLPPNEMLTFIHVKDRMFYAEHSYYRVYTHLTMYCCGIFVAFLVHEYSDLKISKKMSWFLWIITLTGFAASSTVVHEWNTGLVPSPLVSALYTSFSKVAEAAFLSWVSVACMTGHGGLIKDYLSWRPFAFLARLVFLAHLMHVPVITMVNGFRKSHFFVNELEIFYEALTNMVATLVIAYILFMGFEAPFISLTQLLTKKFRNRLNSNDMEPPITEKPIKFADKMKNTVSTSPQLKVWMNINEKSRC
nr:nose resistant to fluoxetine protein 6 [Parasteatoda tepidariorum]